MNRRTALTLLVGGLGPTAGCLGSKPGTPTETTQSLSVPDLTVQADETPPDDRVTWTASVEAQFSTSGPARIEIGFTNEAATARTFEFGAVVPFSEVRAGPTSLVLWPNDDGVSVVGGSDGETESPTGDPGEVCWRTDGRPILPEVLQRRTVEPDETVRETYDVLAAKDASGCLASGSFRFSQGVDEVVGEDETEPLSRWGFTLTLDWP